MKVFTNGRRKIPYALLFSLIVHGVFLISTFQIMGNKFPTQKMVQLKPKKTKDHIQLDEIKFISKKELRAIKDIQGKQIVANETISKNERPKNSRFVGEKDQTFDRQTMAATNGAFKAAGLGIKEGSQNSTIQNHLAPKQKISRKIVGNKVEKTMKKSLTLSDLGQFKVSDLEEMDKKDKETLDEMTKGLKEEKKISALGVSQGKAGINGLAQNSDFVEDVPLGDMTNLNTTEYKYYGFYHRIRQKLEQHWGSSIKAKARNLYRTGKRMPSSENLITSVTVVLNDLGQIIDMQIEGTSGVKELDQAAIESFNKAGPFPNPPKGLMVDGRATIQWGFVVKS